MGRRSTLNAIIDILQLATFIPTLATGLVLYVVFPDGGYQGGQNASYIGQYLGLTRHEWLVFHDIASFAFASLVILHLVLHWRYYRPRYIRRCLARRPENEGRDTCSDGAQPSFR